jgi:hypothetical protein
LVVALGTFILSFTRSRASGETLPLRFGRMCKVHLRAFQTYSLRGFSGRDEGVVLAFLFLNSLILFRSAYDLLRHARRPTPLLYLRYGQELWVFGESKQLSRRWLLCRA